MLSRLALGEFRIHEPNTKMTQNSSKNKGEYARRGPRLLVSV